MRRIKCPLFSLITGCSWLGDTRQFILILINFYAPPPLRKMEGISLCCCLSVSRSVGRLIYAPWTSKNSHFFQFPFIFFSGVAPTEIKFAIQIYNVWQNYAPLVVKKIQLFDDKNVRSFSSQRLYLLIWNLV